MRALEKNILVVSTTEPGNRRHQDRPVNGLETERATEESGDMDVPWRAIENDEFRNTQQNDFSALMNESHMCTLSDDQLYVSIKPVAVSESCVNTEKNEAVEEDVTVTITPIPAGVQKRRNSIEPIVESSDESTGSSEDGVSQKLEVFIDR